MLLGDADDDHERRERAEGVHVVGGAQLASPHERVAETGAARPSRGRDSEPDEGEPGERRQDERAHAARETAA